MCVDLQTNVNNCGACAKKCAVSDPSLGGPSTCVAAQCYCGDGFPASSAANPLVEGECGEVYDEYAGLYISVPVTPQVQYSLSFNAYDEPDKFIVRDGEECGPILTNTGFRGSVDYGCDTSSPCCDPAYYPNAGCTGTPGQYCPAGPGLGLSPDFTPTKDTVVMVDIGGCSGTAFLFSLQGSAGGNCPQVPN